MKNKADKDKTTMTAREVAILIEDLRSQFRIFGEELSAVKKRVDAIFEEQGRLKEEIFVIKADIRIMKADIRTLKEDVSILKTDVKEIKESLKDHGKRLTHLEVIK